MRVDPQTLINDLISELKNPLFSDMMCTGNGMSECMDKIMRKSEVIRNHPHPIYHTDKYGWFTLVDNPITGKKKKIRKKKEQDFIESLKNWYLLHSQSNTSLAELFPEWLNQKRVPGVNDSNIRRIEASWNAYYDKEPLSEKLIHMPISEISCLILRKWAEDLMKKHQPNRKKYLRIFAIINQLLEYASDEEIAIINENLWLKAKKKINNKLIYKDPPVSNESQIFSREEYCKIKQMVYDDLDRYTSKPSSAGLQILFLFETALRIGECCGLKWSDIKGDWLSVQRQANNKGVIAHTKSDSSTRVIYLTEEARHILADVKAFNEKHGYNAEWIFQGNNANYDYRLGYNAADRKLRKLCTRLGIVMKSPHKCRKTCLSLLLDTPGLNKRDIQNFAGHEDITTTLQHYYYSTNSKEEVAKSFEQAISSAYRDTTVPNRTT